MPVARPTSIAPGSGSMLGQGRRADVKRRGQLHLSKKLAHPTQSHDYNDKCHHLFYRAQAAQDYKDSPHNCSRCGGCLPQQPYDDERKARQRESLKIEGHQTTTSAYGGLCTHCPGPRTKKSLKEHCNVDGYYDYKNSAPMSIHPRTSWQSNFQHDV